MSLKMHDARGLASIHTGKPSVGDTGLAKTTYEILAHCYQLKVIDNITYSTLANDYLPNSIVIRAAGTYSTCMCDSWRFICAGNISGAKPQVPSNMAAVGQCHGLGMYTSCGIQLDLWGTIQTDSEAIDEINCLGLPELTGGHHQQIPSSTSLPSNLERQHLSCMLAQNRTHAIADTLRKNMNHAGLIPFFDCTLLPCEVKPEG